MRKTFWVLAIAALIAAGAAFPRAQADDLQVPRGTRLLVVAPHPDDETLAAGGLIRRVESTGGSVMVVLVTSGDAFAEGVEKEDRITQPTPDDYRNYGTLRNGETVAAMKVLGVPRQRVRFLGFPDDGLCMLASKYLTAKQAFESRYTDRVSPPLTEQVIRNVRYRGTDVEAELERILSAFAPTLVVGPHPQDAHPDHCSAHIFLREALSKWAGQTGTAGPRVLHYIVHYRSWPLSDDAGAGADLHPPADFPAGEGRWRTLKLTPQEIALKKQAVLAYSSQMLVIGRFMTAFARGNELFLEGEPAHLPECWCDGENVATELKPDQYQRRPPKR